MESELIRVAEVPVGGRRLSDGHSVGSWRSPHAKAPLAGRSSHAPPCCAVRQKPAGVSAPVATELSLSRDSHSLGLARCGGGGTAGRSAPCAPWTVELSATRWQGLAEKDKPDMLCNKDRTLKAMSSVGQCFRIANQKSAVSDMCSRTPCACAGTS